MAMWSNQNLTHSPTVGTRPLASGRPASRCRSNARTLTVTSARVRPRTCRRSLRPTSRPPIETNPCQRPCSSRRMLLRPAFRLVLLRVVLATDITILPGHRLAFANCQSVSGNRGLPRPEVRTARLRPVFHRPGHRISVSSCCAGASADPHRRTQLRADPATDQPRSRPLHQVALAGEACPNFTTAAVVDRSAAPHQPFGERRRLLGDSAPPGPDQLASTAMLRPVTPTVGLPGNAAVGTTTPVL